MIDARSFLAALKQENVNFFSGVPCSLLGGLFSELETDPAFVSASIEGEALAIAAGAWCAGKNTAVFLQNSGLGNLVNGLTSLNQPFEIPTLLFIGWRGEPGVPDEPQHESMGKISTALLDLMDIHWWHLSSSQEAALQQLQEAGAHVRETKKPVAFLVSKNTFSAGTKPPRIKPPEQHTEHSLGDATTNRPMPILTRYQALEVLRQHTPSDTGIVATTGKCGRELFTISDRREHLYMVGAMGSASAVGLGAALNTQKPIMVIDGDGAALMRLGTLAVIGAKSPKNLIHIVLDNGCHESTGGQPTGAPDTNFPGIARACGYRNVHSCASPQDIKTAIATCKRNNGPAFIHIPVLVGDTENLARPSIRPNGAAQRFKAYLIGQ